MQFPVLLFFDISAGELIIILLVAFVVFGPSRIPEIARKIGRGINEVRRASDEIKREITKETRKMESSLSVDDLDPSKPKPKPNNIHNNPALKKGKAATPPDMAKGTGDENIPGETPPEAT